MNHAVHVFAALAMVAVAPFASAADHDRNCHWQIIDAEQGIQALVCTPDSTTTVHDTSDGTGKEIMIEDASIQGDVGSIGVAL